MKNSIVWFTTMAASAQLALSAIVSSQPQPSLSAGGNSLNPAFSADGQHLVFVSHANNLVTNDDLGLWLDVFVRDLVNSNTALVSVSTNGVGGANWDANYPSISSNGQFIAFASRASNLVPGDTNDAVDVFVRDVNAGVTRLVNVDVNGNAAADPTPSSLIPLAGNPLISGDGRWVFFESRATNLVAGGAPLGSVNIYARDTWSNITALVSMDTNGLPLSGLSALGSITPDARYAAFSSTNKAVTAGVDNVGFGSGADVYVRDRSAHVTRWASTNASAAFGGGSYGCKYPLVARSGSGLAFTATGDTGVTVPMFFDLQTGVRTTIYPSGTTNLPLVLNADASLIAFEGGDAFWTRILLWNRASNSVSTVHEKQLANYPANRTFVDSLSDDGGFVVYREFGSDSPYFTNTFIPRYHVFRKDLLSNAIVLISANTNLTASAVDFLFSEVAASANAGRVAFDSVANDLAAQDLNGMSDIFLRDVNAGTTELITKAQPSKPAATAFTHSFLGPNSVSADGRFVVSTRYDDPSADRDTNGWADVFVSDRDSGESRSLSVDTNIYMSSGGGGPPTPFELPNTNAYFSPVISADGSTVAAVRRAGGLLSRVDVVWARASNNVFGSGMSVANRSDSSGGTLIGNGSSYAPSLSPDGRSIVFTTTSSDFVFENGTDNFSLPDVVLRRTTLGTNGLVTGTNYLVSVSMAGVAGNGASSNGIISPDGRWVIFESTATDLVTNNTGGVLSIFARDLLSNVTHLVSAVSPLVGPTPVNCYPASARISGNSRYVAFALSSGWPYVIVHDLNNWTNVWFYSGESSGFPNSPVGLAMDVSGRFVAYRRSLSFFVSPAGDMLVIDTLDGHQELISGPPSGAFFDRAMSAPAISGDGRYVAFQSIANDLVPNDPNGMNDIFVRDRLLGVTMLVSANAQGRPGNGPSTRPVLAADGRTVVFQSFASDLAAGDYNDKRDVFVLKLGGVDSDGDGLDDDWEVAYFDNLSRDGLGDFDGDGASDLQEFLACTDPENAGSVFRVLTVSPAGGGGKLLFWTGNPNRSYRAEFKDDVSASSWTALTGTISWNGSTASIVDPTATNSTHRYYRAIRLP